MCVTPIDIHIGVGVPCIPKPFRSNLTFVSNSALVVDGDIRFSKFSLDRNSVEYNNIRTVFGPVCSSNFALLRIDANSIGLCFRRQSQTRNPLDPEFHWRLVRNSLLFKLRFSSGLKKWFEHIHSHLVEVFGAEMDPDDLRDMWVNAPHKKKVLRVRASANLFGHGVVFDRRYMRKTKAFAKPYELLKRGSYPRCVIDCTVNGSLKCSYFASMVKEAWSHPFVYNNCMSVFMNGPSRSELKDMFTSFLQPVHGIEHYYFSDDGIISIVCEDGVMYFKDDFVKADSSPTDGTFEVLRESIVFDEKFAKDVDGCLAQFKSPVVVRNIEFPKQKVDMIPIVHKGYSGNSWTTSFNNTGRVKYSVTMGANYRPTIKKSEAYAFLKYCAELAGYETELVHCPSYHHVDFLKTTIVRNTIGEFEAIDCIGSLLKGLGHCAAHLPGLSLESKRESLRVRGISVPLTKDRLNDGSFTEVYLEERAILYTSEVYRGKVHSGNHVITYALRNLVVDRSVKFDITGTQYYKDQINKPVHEVEGTISGHVDADELAIRYNRKGCELEELGMMIESGKLRQQLHHPCLDSIFSVDYGV